LALKTSGIHVKLAVNHRSILTSTTHDASEPVWNREFEIDVKDMAGKIQMEVMDMSDKVIGANDFDFCEFTNKTEDQD